MLLSSTMVCHGNAALAWLDIPIYLPVHDRLEKRGQSSVMTHEDSDSES